MRNSFSVSSMAGVTSEPTFRRHKDEHKNNCTHFPTLFKHKLWVILSKSSLWGIVIRKIPILAGHQTVQSPWQALQTEQLLKNTHTHRLTWSVWTLSSKSGKSMPFIAPLKKSAVCRGRSSLLCELHRSFYRGGPGLGANSARVCVCVRRKEMSMKTMRCGFPEGGVKLQNRVEFLSPAWSAFDLVVNGLRSILDVFNVDLLLSPVTKNQSTVS